MKRTATTIKQFDYTNKEEFKKDIERMKKKGYTLINNGMFGGTLEPNELNDDKWKYTAFFMKSSL